MVKEQVIEWAKRYIDPEFKFREYQLDEIVKVIHRILDSPDLDYQDCLENNKKQNEHITTINAPTGSGKSLILIISAGVLYTYYRKNSYILVSDTYLWKQYDDFLVSHPKLANMFGSIKGQQNPEFVCQVNDENVTKGACRLKGISWVKMSNDNTTDKLGYKCASTCPYLCKRKHSQLTPITIMTYHLWVTATCAENPLNDGSIKTQWKWGERDVTFGDESHNIPSIFGNIYSQVWSWNRIEKLVDLIEFAKGLKADLSALSFLDDRDLDEISATGISNEIDCIVNTYPSREDVYAKFKPYFDFWETNGVNEDPSKIVKSLNRLYDDMGGFMDFGAKMLTYFNAKNEYNNASSMSTNEYALYDLCTWLSGLEHNMRNWMNMTSGNAVVINNTYIDKHGEIKESFTIRDADEAYTIRERFLHNNVVVTSATTGPKDISDRELGISIEPYHYDEKLKYTERKDVEFKFYFDTIPSTFDYSKSPINVVSRWNMGMKYKKQNLPLVADAIYKIIGSQPNDKGIIHTHTYDNAKYLFANAPDNIKYRMLLYNDSKDKHYILEQHINSRVPTVLIGPTLSEGVDMPGDLCRFLVIMKMPYPYLGDELVKAKIKLFPYWYASTTAKTLVQSIGRGNRYKDDWCKTYILDSAFIRFYNENKWQFPKEMQERMRFFK